MRELKNSEGLEVLTSRLDSYLNFYQKLRVSDPRHSLSQKLARKLQRKDRNRSRRLGSTPYQRVYESSIEVKAKERLAEPKIGLGIDSILPPTQKVRRDQVRIDTHAAPRKQSVLSRPICRWVGTNPRSRLRPAQASCIWRLCNLPPPPRLQTPG